MVALCFGSVGLTSGALSCHSFSPLNHSSLQWTPLFLYSPARSGLNLSSGFSSFSSGELHICRAPSSPLLRRFPWRNHGVFMAKARDFYEALNLRRGATIKEIKSSYRNLARKYHPDMNKSPGAEEKFKEISAAYEVLSDEEKRSMYDQYGETGLQGDYAGADTGQEGIDPFEVFNAFFRQSNGLFGDEMDFNEINFNSRFKQSLDIRHDLSLSFEESICGGQREESIECYETCDSCNGSGAKSSKSFKACSHCGGRGGVMKTQKTPFGAISQVSSCSSCGGRGKIITDLCKMCDGEGRLQIKRHVKIDIPAGVSDGSTIQIQGEGSSDKKRGIVGDLYLVIHVKEKSGIRRVGLNLYTDISIDYTEAILGTTIKVETVKGSLDLCIPPGTQPGEILKFSNMGVPNVKKPSVKGDHHFIVRVQIPKSLSENERFLVEQLASIRNTADDSIPQRGVFQYDDTKQKTRNQPSHASQRYQKEYNPSLWGSFKNLFKGNRKGSNFASIATHSVLPPWPSVQAVPKFAFPVGFILAACILSVVGRNFRCLVLQRRRNSDSDQKQVD